MIVIKTFNEAFMKSSGEEYTMPDQALVVIDIQNDITPHYRDIVDALNAAVDWA